MSEDARLLGGRATPRDLTFNEIAMLRNSVFPPSMEYSDALMTLNMVGFVDALPAVPKVKALLEQELLFFWRFRSTFDPKTGKVVPVDVDLDKHIVEVKDPALLKLPPMEAVAKISLQSLDP